MDSEEKRQQRLAEMEEARRVLSLFFSRHGTVNIMRTEFDKPCISYQAFGPLVTNRDIGHIQAGTECLETRISVTYGYILIKVKNRTHVLETENSKIELPMHTISVECFTFDPSSPDACNSPMDGQVCCLCLKKTCKVYKIPGPGGYGYNYGCSACVSFDTLLGIYSKEGVPRDKDSLGREVRHLNQTPDNTGFTLENVYYI
ncbi:MAG: hypothetical protein JSS82_00265 [Bacteroidetes bacterium]|nr:hypothetical protein [Bacteroidota bacterium]